MEKFAKLFEVKEGQILVVKEWDNEDDTFKVRISSMAANCMATMSLGFNEDKEDAQLEMFNTFDQAKAEFWYEKIQNLDLVK